MNITQVYYVLAVAKCRSFSAAAQELFVSQPALSKQIRSLEIELGYDLFNRASQGVTLTREGERFCRYGQQALDSWEYFQRQVNYEDKSVTRRLRIGLGSRVYSNGLFEDVMRFFENHLELEVTFVAEAGKDFLAELSEGRLDLIIHHHEFPWLRIAGRRSHARSLQTFENMLPCHRLGSILSVTLSF